MVKNNITIEDDVSKQEIAGKILWSIEEIMLMTGLGEKKVRQMLKDPNSTFTVKNGNRYFAHRDLLNAHLERCARYGLTV